MHIQGVYLNEIQAMITTLLTSLCIAMLFMTGAWLFSLYKRDMSVVDGFWGLGFLAIAHHWFFRLEEAQLRQFAVVYLVTIWGLRLSAHIFIRSKGKPEDPRYTAFRNEWKENTWWISYFKVFLLQAVLCFVISLPVINVLAHHEEGFSCLNVVGLILWFIGFAFESTADYQLFRFKKNPANKGQVMNKGLWYFSRHPNYFGEVCVWWGIFLVSIGSGLWYISVLGPILITFLLLRVSGITMLEKRYEGNDAYSLYKKNTSPFFPWWPKK